MTATLSVTSGVLRAGHAVVAGTSRGGPPGPVDLLVLGAGRRELLRVDLGAGIGRGQAATDDELPFEVSVDIRDLAGPIRAIEPQAGDGSTTVELGAGYQLGELFLESDEEYDRAAVGRRRSARPRDKETDCFFSRQMAESFPGSFEARSLMAIAYCYRATETLSAPDMERALAILDELAPGLARLKSNAAFRKDPLHLRVSMLTARWLAELALERFDAFPASLLEVRRLMPEVVASDLVFVISYNAVRSLLALAGWQMLCGDHAAALDTLRASRRVLTAAAHSLGDGEVLGEFGTTCLLAADAAGFRKTLARHVAGKPPRIDHEAVIRMVQRCMRASNAATLIGTFRRAVDNATADQAG